MLVAKEQRLKFLKQQELRHQQLANENDRLRKLREKVESQELKLKKLRALKGEVNDYKSNNTSLTSELESIKALFNEKEKELSVAVAKVEGLTEQLEELRRGSTTTNDNRNKTPAHNELDKLKQELMLRNKLNEEQNSKLSGHREVLSQRKDEMAKMDKRISELQARLRRKRALAEQRNNIISSKSTASMNNKAGRPLSANIAAVEPYIQRPQHQQPEGRDEMIKPEYPIQKHDPKYQTLPHSIKFPSNGPSNGSGDKDEVDNNNKGESHKFNHITGKPGGVGGYSTAAPSILTTLGLPTSGSSQVSPTGRTSAGMMSNFAPKPYGSIGGYSTALTTGSGRAPVSSVPPVYTTPGSHLGGPKTSTPITPGGESRTASMKEIFITGGPAAPPSSAPHPSAPPRGTVTSSSTGGGKSYLGNSTPAPYPGGSNSTGTTPSNPPYPSATSAPPSVRPPVPPNYAASMANRLHPPKFGPRPQGDPGPPSPASSSSSQGYYKPTTQPPPPPPSSTAPAGSSNTTTGVSSVSRPQQLPTGGATTRVDNSTFLPRSAANTYPGNRQVNNTTNNWHNNPSNSTTNASNSTTASSIGGNTQQAQGDQNTVEPDTSPTNVMSALDILKAGGPGMGGAPKTYRYAPKSVIANTYMRKLGSSTLEKYRANMSALYKDFVPGTTQNVDNKTPGSPTATVRPLQAGSGTTDVQGQGQGYDRLSNGPAPYPGDVEKRHRPNAPRPLRRRLSQEGASDDYHSRTGGSRLSPTQEGVTSFQGNRPTSPPSSDDVMRVVRVDHVQDSLTVYQDTSKASSHSYNSDSTSGISTETSSGSLITEREKSLPAPLRHKKTNLKNKDSVRNSRRVSFDPLALLLDASLEGELELVKRTAKELYTLGASHWLFGVTDPSAPNDEGITALHNAICAGHYGIVKFLIEFGCNVNAPDSDGWTPLHCAASCNNLPMVKFLVEHGACIFATTISDHETAAEKCEEDEDGFDGCSEYLYSIQEKLGILNHGKVYAVFDYVSMNSDELSFETNNELLILRKGDENEMEWWWARKGNRDGYIPRNLLGLTPRVEPQWLKRNQTS